MVDGGAAYGVVPKGIWQRNTPADENNMIKLANRSLLIEQDDKLILIDTGIGNKQDADTLKHYYISNNDGLINSIKKLGFTTDDITDVVFTHLHFDHCGGATKYTHDRSRIITSFKNANYWVSKLQWDTALNPNCREGATYFEENYVPIADNGQLKFVYENDFELCNNIKLRIYNGHTFGQIIPVINYKNRVIVYAADFIPSLYHIPSAYVSAYDIQPIVAMEEKTTFLKEALDNNYILFFEHDLNNECCDLQLTPKGIRHNNIFKVNEI